MTRCRAELLGFDLYQNGDAPFGARMDAVLQWLDGAGASQMIGIAEMGCSESFGPPGAAAYWRDAWSWAMANVARSGVISYFNSTRNSNLSWSLAQSPALLDAFQESLASWAPAGCPGRDRTTCPQPSQSVEAQRFGRVWQPQRDSNPCLHLERSATDLGHDLPRRKRW